MLFRSAGAGAVLIEDKITPRALTAAGKPCLPREEARMKVRAAVQAAKASGILVMARTDCRPTAGIDEAVARIEMFTEEGADTKMMKRQSHDRVRQMLDLLPEDQREVIILRHYADLSFKEIAALTNCSINTALGRMRYGLINLRKMMTEKKIAL